MNAQRIVSRVLDGLILIVFILFFSSAGFQDRNTSGWYQQWFPNLNGSSITSITFLDSLTGCAVTNTNSSLEGYILRTSNGGDNWNIVYTYKPVASSISFNKIAFADTNTGFATVNYYPCFKTTNSGLNWFVVGNSDWGAADLAVINKDTLLSVNSSGLGGGVYRSTNGGINWSPLGQVGGNGQPSRIYMFDKNLGFTISSNGMRRTTNGGFNWTLTSGNGFTGIEFVDSLTGWKTRDGIQKTTDGGLNWITQNLPNIPHSYLNTNLKIINKDTVWMVGDESSYFALYRTTNGGLNWGYQKVDTSIHIYIYNFINFVNNQVGWAYSRYNTSGIHTITGGNDTTFLTRINNNVTVTPKDYTLYQNYPNPFNSSTVIRYQVFRHGGRTERAVVSVSIKVYDVQGHEVQTLVQGKLNPGVYEYIFNGNNLASGIYFYSMIIDGKAFDTKRMILLK